MLVFYFSQYEYEPFWSYLSRLNEYRAQLNHNFEKWKFCEIIVVGLMGLNVESRSYITSICFWGLIELLSKTQNEVWDFFEKLAWETFAFEQANITFKYTTQGEYDFQVNSYPSDHSVNSYDPSYCYMPPVLYDYCESSYHDARTCLFCAYVDATCASFEKKINEMTDQMIEMMKAQIAACSPCLSKIGRLLVRLILV